MDISVKIVILCYLRYNHKIIDKIIARIDSKYHKDSKFHFWNLSIVTLGETDILT